MSDGAHSAESAIRALIDSYFNALDQRDFTLLADCFTEDSQTSYLGGAWCCNGRWATVEQLLGAKAGLDPRAMVDVLRVSSGTNHSIESKIPKYLLRGVPMGFSLDLSLKDVTLAVAAGEALGMPMRMGRITAEVWQQAMDARGAKQDYLQVVRVFEDLAGVRWTPTNS
jgi:hypothetical protein